MEDEIESRNIEHDPGHFNRPDCSPVLRGLVDSGRKVLAGILFITPGILSDGVALLLLLLPINNGRLRPQAAAAGRASYHRNEVIDGEFRRTE